MSYAGYLEDAVRIDDNSTSTSLMSIVILSLLWLWRPKDPSYFKEEADAIATIIKIRIAAIAIVKRFCQSSGVFGCKTLKTILHM